MTLDKIDLEKGKSGFKDLLTFKQPEDQKMKFGETSFTRVMRDNEEYNIAMRPIQLKEPYINWTLALLLSDDLIDEPLERILRERIVINIIAIIAMGIIFSMFIQQQLIPLKRMTKQISNYNDDGVINLQNTVSVTTKDEVGVVGKEVNDVVSFIRDNVQQSDFIATQVKEISHALNDSANSTRKCNFFCYG